MLEVFKFVSLQEACPPKLSQMAYVTAGTYYEEEILQMELIVLKVRCETCPITFLHSWSIRVVWFLDVVLPGVGLEPVSWNSRVLVDSLLPDGIDEQKLGPAGAAVFTGRLRTNDPCRCLDSRLSCCHSGLLTLSWDWLFVDDVFLPSSS